MENLKQLLVDTYLRALLVGLVLGVIMVVAGLILCLIYGAHFHEEPVMAGRHLPVAGVFIGLLLFVLSSASGHTVETLEKKWNMEAKPVEHWRFISVCCVLAALGNVFYLAAAPIGFSNTKDTELVLSKIREMSDTCLRAQRLDVILANFQSNGSVEKTGETIVFTFTTPVIIAGIAGTERQSIEFASGELPYVMSQLRSRDQFASLMANPGTVLAN